MASPTVQVLKKVLKYTLYVAGAALLIGMGGAAVMTFLQAFGTYGRFFNAIAPAWHAAMEFIGTGAALKLSIFGAGAGALYGTGKGLMDNQRARDMGEGDTPARTAVREPSRAKDNGYDTLYQQYGIEPKTDNAQRVAARAAAPGAAREV